MYKSSSLCLYSSNLGIFWLKIKQFWPFEEISIFSNGGHLGWRAWLSDITFKGNSLRMIQAKFGLNWPSGFRGEDIWKSLQTDDRRQVMAIAHTGELKTRNFTTSTFLFFWYLDEPRDHSVWYNSSNYKNWGEKTLNNTNSCNQRLSRACIVHLVIKRTNWSYVKLCPAVVVILELRST
jgi:hypothetical protein